MSYDLYFTRRAPGESWAEKLETVDALEVREPDPVAWSHVLAGARELLGEVRVIEYPPDWELEDDVTGISVQHWQGGWDVTIPYRTHGEEARRMVRLLYQVAALVERVSGFECFDPQLGLPLSEVADPPASAGPYFDAVADRMSGGESAGAA